MGKDGGGVGARRTGRRLMMGGRGSPRANGTYTAECVRDVESWTIRESVRHIAPGATAAGLDDGGGTRRAADWASWDC